MFLAHLIWVIILLLTHRHELGFIPETEWSSQSQSLSELQQNFFIRRNGNGQRFPYKLYHALLITKTYPAAYWFTGVCWITPTVFKVNSLKFAALLGIRAIQGGLFHKQGNFSRHLFVQVMKNSSPEIETHPDCNDVDDCNIRLFTDPHHRFGRDQTYDISKEPANITDA